MVSPIALLVTLLLVLSNAERTILDNRKHIPKPWQQLGKANDDERLTFIIALKQKNLDLLEQLYWDRSNPDSTNYQNWLTIKEINDLVSPGPEIHDQVLPWLKNSAVTVIKSYGDAIEATANVAVLRKLFHTEFYVFQNDKGNKIVRQVQHYSIPSELSSYIEMVTGISNFPHPKTRYGKQIIPSQKRQIIDWDTYVVPQTLYALYQIPKGTQAANTTSQCVVEWEGQNFSANDLQGFATNMAVPNLNPLTTDHIIGPNDPSLPGTESTLDIEWIAATGIGAQNWFWLEAGTSWLYGFAVHFMNTQTVPLVNSMSYGWNEEDQCEDGIGGTECSQLGLNSTQYVQRVNVEFQKIGLRGITLFAASGDSGANGRTDAGCIEDHFNPAFPAASPYVTSVGATELVDVSVSLPNPPPVCTGADYWFCASNGTEQAVAFLTSNFASGGGFSFVAPMPAWQQSAVAAYLATDAGKKAPATYYNAKGRAYPDIAALGSRILIWEGGMSSSVGGTSCSAPIVAGIFTLLNDYAIKTTKKPLGPVNQLIYKMAAEYPQAFTDVVTGDNVCTESGCGIPIISPCQGFYAAAGWDAVTGWGTPRYSEMLKYLQKLFAKKNNI